MLVLKILLERLRRKKTWDLPTTEQIKVIDSIYKKYKDLADMKEKFIRYLVSIDF